MSRVLFLIAGLLLVALGAAGLILPLLPSTIFFILAAACFARSSPRLEAWLLSLPAVGDAVTAWRRNGAIPLRAKWLASAGMAVGLGAYAATSPSPLRMIGAATVLACCALFVWSRPAE